MDAHCFQVSLGEMMGDTIEAMDSGWAEVLERGGIASQS